MTLVTAGLILASLTAQDSPDIVKLLGRDVPIEFPTGGPVASGTPSVERAGWKWEIKPDGTLGHRFHTDGGWGDLKELYRLSKGKPGATPYLVKVVIHQHEATIRTNKAGVVRQHWASIDDEDLTTILKSSALLKAAIEGSTGGAYDVKLDVQLDNDIEIAYSDARQPAVPEVVAPKVGVDDFGSVTAENSLPKQRLVYEIGPLINDEKFDTDDGVYSGPFAVVFDIHPGNAASDGIGFVDNTPVASLSYFTFSDLPAKDSLPAAMYEIWKRMVVASACSRGSVPRAIHTEGEYAYPKLVSGPIWEALVDRSRRTMPADPNLKSVSLTTIGDLAKSTLPVVEALDTPGHLVVAAPGSADKCLVDLESADFALGGLANSATLQVTGIGCGPQSEFLEVNTRASDVVASLGSVSTVPSARTRPLETPGTVVGDFGASQKEGPNGVKAWEVTFASSICRGYVVLATGDPYLAAGQTGFLSFDAKLSADEEVSLELVGSDGAHVGSILVGGESFESGVVNTADAEIPADDQWHRVTVSLQSVTGGKEVREVRVRGGFDRLSRGPSPFGITAPVVSDSGTPTLSRSASNPALEISKISGSPTAEQATLLLAALASTTQTVRINAIAVLSRVKLSESVLALTELSHSGFAPVAALADKALGFQDTPEAWAAIRDTVERGPFDHNRRFAAMELTKKPDPAMGASLNFMAARSWHARFESVRALAAINSTSSAIIMSTMLQLEPVAAVRLEIAKTADTNVELVTTRLIYAAVNDPSQWVRATAYGRLIDSPNKSVQADALKGVKDDAVGVRLYLLNLMATRAKEDYRSALRSAVTDPVSAVRVAALKAFAVQPGPVEANEVKNTWTDPDPAVRKALADLAKAKGFKVPTH